MVAVLALSGALILLLGLRDVFHTLFHPDHLGSASTWVCARTWRLARRGGSRVEELAGPVAVIVTILFWVLVTMLGFSLLYLPFLPERATFGEGVPVDGVPVWAHALYLSSVTMSTLGFGDVVLTGTWSRLLTALQGLLGFAVLTAALTWISQLRPALTRRRTLALEVALHRHPVGPDPDGADGGPAQLESWARALTGVLVDLWQNSETFYFRERDPRFSFGRLLADLHDLTSTLTESECADVRAAAGQLEVVLAETFQVLHRQFGLPDERDAALRHLVPV
jgi:hypothetical protein